MQTIFGIFDDLAAGSFGKTRSRLSITFALGISVLLAACGTVKSVTLQQPAAAQAVADAAALNAVQALQREIAADPENSMLRYILSSRAMAAGDRELALLQLRETMRLGEGFLPPRDLGMQVLNGDGEYEAIRHQMESALPRVNSDAPRAFTLAERNLIPEGIAHDAATRRVFIGCTVQKKILAIDAQGRETTFVQDESLDSLLGLAIDGKANRLIAISTNGFVEKNASRIRNMVVLYDLLDAKEVERIVIAPALQLNDLAILPNGDLVISDTLAHRVWLISGKAGSRQVAALTPEGATRGANGIAASADGKHVYVAASRALLRVRMMDGFIEPVRLPARQSLAAIDGLVMHQGALLGIQNSTNPGRLIRAELSEDGLSVTRVETLLSHHHPDVAVPTTLALAGESAYVLATTNVAAMGNGGVLDQSAKLASPVILKVPVASSAKPRAK